MCPAKKRVDPSSVVNAQAMTVQPIIDSPYFVYCTYVCTCVCMNSYGFSYCMYLQSLCNVDSVCNPIGVTGSTSVLF